MTSATLPSSTGIVSAYTYDGADRLTGISHVKDGSTTIASVAYTLDDVGNRTQRVDQQGTHTYAYDDLYWAYMYDDFFDGIFFPYGAPYVGYAHAGPYERVTTSRRSSRQPALASVPGRVSEPAQRLCNEPGSGVTAWPIEDIEKALKPTDAQHVLLTDLKQASEAAAEKFKQACPEHVPLTPTGRLAAMTEVAQERGELRLVLVVGQGARLAHGRFELVAQGIVGRGERLGALYRAIGRGQGAACYKRNAAAHKKGRIGGSGQSVERGTEHGAPSRSKVTELRWPVRGGSN